MNSIHVLYPEKIGRINPNIYGHFTEHIGGVIYDGIWVGEDSTVPNINGFRKRLVELIRAIKPPVIRWPGGCFAETYNWRDGIGPREKRPVTVNWWYNSDHRLESNHVGTHEFIKFCNMVGAEPYFAANVSSLCPLDIRDWMEYCNFDRDTTTLAKLRERNGAAEPFNVRYWGLGNENWGGGGDMTPDDYCAIYRQYAVTAGSVDKECKFIACGANADDLDWTRRFFSKIFDRTLKTASKLDGYAIHHYCHNDGNDVDYQMEQWYEILHKAFFMDSIIKRHRAVMDSYDPGRKIGIVVDEWGSWHNTGLVPLPDGNIFEQQNTIRDAVLAAVTLNIFNNQCDKVVMANIAQLVNCLHSLFLTKGDKLVATPTYYIFDMMKEHQGAQAIKTVTETEKNSGVDEVSVSASEKDGKTLLTIANTNYSNEAQIEINLCGRNTYSGYADSTTLTGRHNTCNTFDNPMEITPATGKAEVRENKIDLRVPAASVTCLRI